MAIRLSVDVGGTFTDAVYLDEASGEVRVGKCMTTPDAPERGVLEALRSVMRGTPLHDAEFFLHGTTVGLNSLLQRRGPTIGLLATDGFSDVLEIGRGNWGAAYDLRWSPPEPLVPRRLRLGARERIGSDGEVIAPLEPDDVRAALEVFEAEGVESIAVSFINAYANPEHEVQAQSVLREAGFEGEVSLSSAITREYREYERTSTTVIDVYIRPRMTVYLRDLEQGLTDEGFDGTKLVTRSGGGAITFSQATKRPVDTILSGPVGGVQGAAEIARLLDLDRVVTADMGGTSFETSLITGGQPPVTFQGAIDGLPILTPWVDVRTIGAGGGSIAHLDEGGLLRVGPKSAGADPGPVAYGLGGVEPTVTDAAVALGMFGGVGLAGGIELDRDAAVAALDRVGSELGMETEEIARGVVTIATTNMANAIREITVERGEDPRDAALMPFGGAGPLFATLLARELQIPEIVIPPHPGNFSAWGLLGADIVHSASTTRLLALFAPSCTDEIATESDALFVELERRDGVAEEPDAWERELSLDLRYVGQEYTLTVDTDMAAGRPQIDQSSLHESFGRRYEEVFGHAVEDDVEIVSLRAGLRRRLPDVGVVDVRRPDAGDARPGATAYSFVKGDWCEFSVIDRNALAPGDVVEGPAIVLEPIATIYVDAGFTGEINLAGSVHLRRVEEDHG